MLVIELTGADEQVRNLLSPQSCANVLARKLGTAKLANSCGKQSYTTYLQERAAARMAFGRAAYAWGTIVRSRLNRAKLRARGLLRRSRGHRLVQQCKRILPAGSK